MQGEKGREIVITRRERPWNPSILATAAKREAENLFLSKLIDTALSFASYYTYSTLTRTEVFVSKKG